MVGRIRRPWFDSTRRDQLHQRRIEIRVFKSHLIHSNQRRTGMTFLNKPVVREHLLPILIAIAVTAFMFWVTQ